MRKSRYIIPYRVQNLRNPLLILRRRLGVQQNLLTLLEVQKSLYFVDYVIFCDDTFQYSGVSLSSSYEAAKDTYRKVIDVEDRNETIREGKDLNNA